MSVLGGGDSDALDWRRALGVVGLLVLVGVLGLFLTAAVPQLVGADASYVVQSDSMAPAIEAGSMVYVGDVSPARIDEGDVITYRPAGERGRVTHRVVGVVERDGERLFRTKGDANEEADPRLVEGEQVVGSVAFSVPYIGYVVAFAGTDLGLALLVIIPATALMVSELWALFGPQGEAGPEEGETG